VETAATAAAAGTRLDDIVRLVRGMVPHLYGVFFVETLDYLERSKRISKAQAILGTMLGIKPLLNIEDGEIIPLEKVHTRERAVEKLVEFVGEFSTIERMAIVQNNFDAEAATLVKHMAENLPGRQFPMYTYGPSLAAHLGPSAIGVMVYEGRY
jgi:DegV family protein with EDD domain